MPRHKNNRTRNTACICMCWNWDWICIEIVYFAKKCISWWDCIVYTEVLSELQRDRVFGLPYFITCFILDRACLLELSLKEKDTIWQDLSFYFSVCLSVGLSVYLSALCTPQFWSHKLVDPHFGSIYVQLDVMKIIFWKIILFYLEIEKKGFSIQI